MLLVEYSVLDKVKVINESKNGITKLKLLGKFQKCDEQNNNGRVYPRKVLENQVKTIQEKIGDRSLVGALDHPANDAIHLSQASHLITKLWVEKNGDVMGECEILSTPNGKIVEALINDGVKIGISSRGLGSVSEGSEGKIVNEDFKLVTFDLVSDPSTKGAFPGLCESMRENSERAQQIISKHKKSRVLLTMLESKINEALKGNQKKLDKDGDKKITKKDLKMMRGDSDTDEGSEGEGSMGEKSEFPDLNGDGETTFADILKGKLKGKKGKKGKEDKEMKREDSSMSFNERVISKIKHKFNELQEEAKVNEDEVDQGKDRIAVGGGGGPGRYRTREPKPEPKPKTKPKFLAPGLLNTPANQTVLRLNKADRAQARKDMQTARDNEAARGK
jgi:hypothetical protein